MFTQVTNFTMFSIDKIFATENNFLMMLLDVLLFHMLYFILDYSAQARLQTYTPAEAYENMAIEKLRISNNKACGGCQ